jgi:hypothetical protein
MIAAGNVCLVRNPPPSLALDHRQVLACLRNCSFGGLTFDAQVAFVQGIFPPAISALHEEGLEHAARCREKGAVIQSTATLTIKLIQSRCLRLNSLFYDYNGTLLALDDSESMRACGEDARASTTTTKGSEGKGGRGGKGGKGSKGIKDKSRDTGGSSTLGVKRSRMTAIDLDDHLGTRSEQRQMDASDAMDELDDHQRFGPGTGNGGDDDDDDDEVAPKTLTPQPYTPNPKP